MKKTLALILVGAVLGSTVAFTASKIFSDVPANTWYTDAVNSLSEKGIIEGYSDGTFGPANNVNRAELAVMFDRLIEYMETRTSPKTCDLECEKYNYGNCPKGCVQRCLPSFCSNGECTTDCNGPGSCSCP